MKNKEKKREREKHREYEHSSLLFLISTLSPPFFLFSSHIGFFGLCFFNFPLRRNSKEVRIEKKSKTTFFKVIFFSLLSLFFFLLTSKVTFPFWRFVISFQVLWNKTFFTCSVCVALQPGVPFSKNLQPIFPFYFLSEIGISFKESKSPPPKSEILNQEKQGTRKKGPDCFN